MSDNSQNTQPPEEHRSYAVIRDDLPLTRTAYLGLSALGFSRMARLCVEKPHLVEGYDKDMQPKLALRAKNAGLIAKAQQALSEQGIDFICVEMEGETVGLFLPPLPRSQIPRAISGLQLFAEPRVPSIEHESPVLSKGDHQYMPIVFRTDLDAPLGKMMAQVGHAAWSATSQTGELLSMLLVGMDDEKIREVGVGDAEQYWQTIVDAGRTVFNAPTPTCMWGGNLATPDHIVALDADVVVTEHVAANPTP